MYVNARERERERKRVVEKVFMRERDWRMNVDQQPCSIVFMKKKMMVRIS